MSQDPSAYMTVSSAWGPLVPNPLSLYGHNYHSQYATKQEDIDDRPVLSIVPPPRKKGRKSKAPAQGENDGKRDKFLERNRVAASKCRQKKKEWVSDLQETKQGLENQHAQLQMEYNGLVNEVTRMKNELMSHANCNDPNINLWLENEARRFVQISADRVKKQSLDASRAVGDRPLGMGGSYMPSIDSQMSLISPSHSERAMTTMSSRSGSSADINYDHMPDSAFEQA
ncbi:BZIP transcription factor [Colletotrichum higginsianum]|nr:BZIP transcription factor [Colletotrichum higginsianum]